MDKRRERWLRDSGFDALNIARNNKVLSEVRCMGKVRHTEGPACALWCKENLPLVASAPELLGACKLALDVLESAVGSDIIPASYVKKEVSELKRAIKNATI